MARSAAASSGHDRTDGGSAIVIASVADYSWMAAAITVATAAIALFMRVHPLWAFAAAALLGLAGVV
jgi:chromate transporter